MSVSGRTILVTGGASFIGSHITHALLDSGANVLAYDSFEFGPPVSLDDFVQHPRLTLIKGDIRDEDAVKQAAGKADGLIHLAAFMTSVIVKRPATGLDVNIAGACKVLSCAAEAGIRSIVLGSSVSAYGAVEGAIDESEGFNPNSLHWGAALYGASKVVAEQFSRMLCERHGVNVLSLRYATVYGPRQHWRGVDAPFFIRTYEQLKQGKPPRITGDGTEAHDYIDVRDAARATVKALGFQAGCDVVNIASGVSTSLNGAVDEIRKLAGGPEEVEYIELPAEERGMTATRFSYDTSKADSVLGFRTRIGLADGLSDLFEWWESEGARKYPIPTMSS
jgi:UDP-glucose 4-epimerase